jgi:hypothetical protein
VFALKGPRCRSGFALTRDSACALVGRTSDAPFDATCLEIYALKRGSTQ